MLLIVNSQQEEFVENHLSDDKLIFFFCLPLFKDHYALTDFHRISGFLSTIVLCDHVANFIYV